jgi:hypothetical protein
VAATLAPYAWREFTDRMLARRVVGEVDRWVVIGFLSGVPGTDIGIEGAVEPAEAGDERVDALLWALDGQQWRGWALARLCAELVAALDAWDAERESLESDLRRLLEGH